MRNALKKEVQDVRAFVTNLMIYGKFSEFQAIDIATHTAPHWRRDVISFLIYGRDPSEIYDTFCKCLASDMWAVGYRFRDLLRLILKIEIVTLDPAR